MKRWWVRLKDRIARKWIWRSNEWCALIDAIDTATRDMEAGICEKAVIPLDFQYLKQGKFRITVEPEKAG